MTAEAEREKLAAFARQVIRVECWGYHSEIDGGDIQEVAEKLGLIEAHVATEDDAAAISDTCAGDRIYRFAPWLKEEKEASVVWTPAHTDAAIASIKAQGGEPTMTADEVIELTRGKIGEEKT
jgi:hypothetical protein